ncbi:MAG: hypothetical protein MZV49_24535 [Rhodopseudomonas palustris]|nr:hypothetical protein [Rhodopseudomonas palustris]
MAAAARRLLPPRRLQGLRVRQGWAQPRVRAQALVGAVITGAGAFLRHRGAAHQAACVSAGCESAGRGAAARGEFGGAGGEQRHQRDLGARARFAATPYGRCRSAIRREALGERPLARRVQGAAAEIAGSGQGLRRGAGADEQRAVRG